MFSHIFENHFTIGAVGCLTIPVPRSQSTTLSKLTRPSCTFRTSLCPEYVRICEDKEKMAGWELHSSEWRLHMPRARHRNDGVRARNGSFKEPRNLWWLRTRLNPLSRLSFQIQCYRLSPTSVLSNKSLSYLSPLLILCKGFAPGSARSSTSEHSTPGAAL